MRQVILHLGTPKTGTTAIQRFFHLNRDELASIDSVSYPTAGRVNNKGKLEISHRPLFASMTAARKKNHSLLSDIDEQALDHRKIVISCEYFFGRLYKQEVQEALKRIKDFFKNDELKIIIYLRRWDSYLDSVYNQAVKASMFDLKAREESINDFFDRCEKVIGWHPADYLKYLAILDDIFGKEAIEIRSFDVKALAGGNLLQDFSEAIAIKSIHPYKMPRKANESLTAKQLLIVSMLSPLYGGKEKLVVVRKVMKKFKDDAGQFDGYCLLGRDERLAIINRFKQDEEKLRSYLRDPTGFLFDLDVSGNKSHLPPVQFSFDELKTFRDLILDAKN